MNRTLIATAAAATILSLTACAAPTTDTAALTEYDAAYLAARDALNGVWAYQTSSNRDLVCDLWNDDQEYAAALMAEEFSPADYTTVERSAAMAAHTDHLNDKC